MPAQLVAVTEGPNILLDKPIVLVGRHQECDIQIPSRKISRRHCCIAQVDDYLVVRDLCSTNGIRINGTRVNEGKLAAGDELTIGNFRYQVSWSNGAAVPVAKPPPRVKDLPKLVPAQGARPYDSGDEPVPLADSVAPDAKPAHPLVLPTNNTLPPPLPSKEEPNEVPR